MGVAPWATRLRTYEMYVWTNLNVTQIEYKFKCPLSCDSADDHRGPGIPVSFVTGYQAVMAGAISATFLQNPEMKGIILYIYTHSVYFARNWRSMVPQHAAGSPRIEPKSWRTSRLTRPCFLSELKRLPDSRGRSGTNEIKGTCRGWRVADKQVIDDNVSFTRDDNSFSWSNPVSKVQIHVGLYRR